MTGRPLRILQVNTFDALGGAATIARGLFEAYSARGHDSWLAVGHKQSDHPRIVRIRNDAPRGRLLRTLAKKVESELGVEDFRFPGTQRILQLTGQTPDLLHAHNLHGGYFDLRALTWLSQQMPVVLTLHDAWLLSGHCGHSLDCQRWKTGCGHCPDLTLDPPVRRDATAYNWRRKESIFRRSRLHVATPCRWLMDKVEQSMLAAAVAEARVIPNGVDDSIFRPGGRAAARGRLGISADALAVLFSGYALRRNVWKDYDAVRLAIGLAAGRLAGRKTLFIALGESGPGEHLGSLEVRFVPYQGDRHVVADYYRAADAYVHAAHADTFPNSVLEALACGTPVVATAVGGIPEQVEDGRTGFLIQAGDAGAMAERLATLLGNESLRRHMSRAAAETARRRYTISRQADSYLGWYADLIRSQRAERTVVSA